MFRVPDTGTIYQRGPVLWHKYKFKGRTFTASLGTADRAEAEKRSRTIMNEARAAILEGRHPAQLTAAAPTPRPVRPTGKVLLVDAWEMYIKSLHRPDTGPDTLRQYACQFGVFVEWCRTKHPDILSLDQVTEAVCCEFAENRRGELAAGTFNKYMNLLSLVFRTLRRADKNIIDAWADITRRKQQPKSRRSMSSEELSRLLNASEGEDRTMILLGYYTGMRLGDCALLRWSDVDLANRKIVLDPHKTRRYGKTVRPFIHPDLEQRIRSLDQSSPYICPEYAAAYENHPSGPSRRLHPVFAKAGLEVFAEGTGKGTGHRAVVELGFHALRHSFVTEAQMNGATPAAVREIAGHGSVAIQRTYTHVGDAALREAIMKLPSICSPPGTATPNHPPASAKLANEIDNLDAASLLEMQARIQRRLETIQRPAEHEVRI